MNDGDEARRRSRNYVVGGILLALVVLFFCITIVRMGGAAS